MCISLFKKSSGAATGISNPPPQEFRRNPADVQKPQTDFTRNPVDVQKPQTSFKRND